ncbi:MAG TPA: peptidylprolyl isomerase [Acidimicrobiales bacterium]|jgi:cyclophilin family peptidyl-prolyl cis-trans isomerase|nr:peptidylprolyl isomerase [Acidimicrobiales bacterium]
MPTEKRERQRAGREARREAARAAQRRAQRRRQIIAIVTLIAVIFGIGLALNLSGGDDDGTDVAADDNNTTSTTLGEDGANATFGSTECPPAEGAAERKTDFPDSFENCLRDGVDYKATIEFDVGTVEVDLAEGDSPVTVNNFVALARHRFYEDVVCHRVLKGFVVQCGDPEGTGSGGPGYTIGEEPPKSGTYEIGQLAMAKTQAPNSTGSQFFIIVGENGAQLPPQYSLLGTITSGLDVAKKIEADGSDADPTPPAVVHKMVKVTIEES